MAFFFKLFTSGKIGEKIRVLAAQACEPKFEPLHAHLKVYKCTAWPFS